MMIFKHSCKKKVSVLTVLFILVTLSGCATLGKEECINADWYTIGYEDGAKGYLTSRIGSHRKDCAKYGITPDFRSYEQGRLEGLEEYCTPRNGYLLGSSGKPYNDVCPPGFESIFSEGYQHGRIVYEARMEMNRHKEDLRRLQNKLSDTNKELKDHESELIHEDMSSRRRKKLLEEIKILTEQRIDLQNQIARQEILVETAVAKFEEISVTNPYQ
jgi:hypothetical protein